MSRANRFMDACFGRPVDRTPVWLMRQAGRYQASYRQLRRRTSFFELCKTPELASRVTVEAVEQLGVDAAIIFSDILVALEAMGAPVELTEAGPRVPQPVRDAAAVQRLVVPDPVEATPYLLDAIRVTRGALAGSVPLIGFAGAPLTLASYLVEGGGSKSFARLKGLLFGEPALAHELLDRLARTVSALLSAQIEAGCDAVQLFDSWAGILGPEDYRALALPHVQRIFEDLRPAGVPRLLFGTCTATLLEAFRDSGAEVIGVDWRVPMAEARARLGPRVTLQGNLDPGCLFVDDDQALARRVRAIVDGARGGGHVFNLGHGVLPNTDEARARRLVELVHAAGTPDTGPDHG